MNMLHYLIRRVFSIIPTLLGMTMIFFIIVNLAPGSPIEKKIQEIKFGVGASGSGPGQGVVTQEVIEALKKQYGFDRPLLERYWIWLKNVATLDFGESFSYEEPVIDVITSRFPVSLQFGIISLILSYLICIPSGCGRRSKTVPDLTYSAASFSTPCMPLRDLCWESFSWFIWPGIPSSISSP